MGFIDFSENAQFAKEYRYALNLLGRREYSTQELRRKLAVRCSSEICEAVIGRLLQENSLSDERFTEMILRHYVGGGYGPGRVLLELAKRGIDRESALLAIRDFDADWSELAYEALERKFALHSRELSYEEKTKIVAWLVRRGFAVAVASQAVKKLFSSEN